jgi:endonuclease YncB( thermonuclease family)
MRRASGKASRHRDFLAAAAICSLTLAVDIGRANAAACNFEGQGEGRVADVIDARSFRLDDGREVRLAGIEPPDKAKGRTALVALVGGREVTLRGEDDTPDRYGRQPAFVFPAGSEVPVQSELLRQGQALVAADVTNKDCATTLLAAEAEARLGKRGIWADPTAIKNAESPGDILAGIGRFAVVEGKVLSVRARSGPRIELVRVGQIEVLGGN